jgi:oxygen-independent coproporphyrinogen-3 oxidase
MLAMRVDSGEVTAADPDAVAEMYEAASERLASVGFRQYELSNWARPGHHSRHNLSYWTDAEYVGIGAGAHGYIGGDRYENIAHPREYMRAVTAAGSRLPVLRSYRPNLPMRLLDWLETGLRRIEGFAFEDFESAFGFPFPAVLIEALQAMADVQVVTLDDVRMALAPRGRLLQNEVVATLLPFIEREFGPMAELLAGWPPLEAEVPLAGVERENAGGQRS